VVHTAEGATTKESLGNFFANPSSEVSSHAGIDDTPGTIAIYVPRGDTAWTQADANSVAVSAELCAFAAWSPAEWANHPNMLDNCAAWIAEEAAAFGIPVRKLAAHDAQGGAAGVCAHSDLGSWGGNHGDPGASFPWDRVISGAAGAPPATTPAPPPPVPSGPPVAAPPWPGRYLTYPPVMQGTDVATWQAQMAARGWALSVDGQYGPGSEQVCISFQSEKDLPVDGVVGPDTWAATWAAPIT
jgi:N-acetyl-anhydromuramyl-L-alanine amidase AmpD